MLAAIYIYIYVCVLWVAQTKKGLSTVWAVRNQNRVRTSNFTPLDFLWNQRASFKIGTGCFPELKCGWDVLLATDSI